MEFENSANTNTIIRAQLFEYSNNPNIRGNTVPNLIHLLENQLILSLDAIASLDWGYESERESLRHFPSVMCNHSKMLSYLLDVWSCFDDFGRLG